MVFSSLAFIFFLLPLFLIFDFLCRKKVILRNIVIIVISTIFYAWDNKIGLLAVYAVLNYLFGFVLFSCAKSRYKFLLLSIFVTINIGGLCFYKYLYWFVELLKQTSDIFASIDVKHRTIPLGISFFTFHAISYLIDISRGEVKRHSVINFITYFFMFPHLVAGPIVRFNHVKEDLSCRTYDKDLFNYGLMRFIVGVNKKILIANSVAPIADTFFYINQSYIYIYIYPQWMRG